ncbi:MAG: hydrolase family protein [Paenibacillus sp.]|nr:hydrolase family protein [Paenibacillus sp.]
MTTVMLLGDSIRMHYQEKVKARLGPDYLVWAPEENGRFAKYTLNSLRFWLGQCPAPDIIHWNNGLWDTAMLYPEDGCFTPLDQYAEDMARILRVLRATGAVVVYATTTPVHPLRAHDPESKQDNGHIELYNRHATELMRKEGVPVNDLYGVVAPHIEAFICEDRIHMTDAGSEACAEAVVHAIQSVWTEYFPKQERMK